MWCDHLFSQRNKAMKRAGGGWTKFEKEKDVGNIGRGVRTLCQLWYTSEN